jgi:DNA polymerase III epsilon subunit family exonuclease
MRLLAGTRIVVLDVETTGWSAATDRIIEIGRVVIVNGTITESWSRLVHSPVPIPEDATRIHGITDAMLAGAPPAAELAASLREACDGATLAIHNAWFDLSFLNAMLRREGLRPLLNPVVDTLGLARGLYGSGGNTLIELAQRHAIAHPTPHRALPDARATAELLLALVPLWETERGVRSLDELAAASQDALRVSRRRASRPASALVDPAAPVLEDLLGP